MSTRPLLWLAVSTALATLCAVALQRVSAPPAVARSGRARIVSLSPAVTETLYALGAGSDVVGVDDFSDYPDETRRLPHVGSISSPSYETVAATAPTLIVAEQLQGLHATDLGALGAVAALPWLTLDEIANSTRRLGQLTGHRAEADRLAARFLAELDVRPPAGGPRVLLALSEIPGKLDQVYFIRKNSIHGAALHAAGARNAVDEEVTAVPRLSLERVLALDPDLVIVLTGYTTDDESTRARVLDEWRALSTLRAVRQRHVGVVSGAEVFSNGPRVLDLPRRLRREIARLVERG